MRKDYARPIESPPIIDGVQAAKEYIPPKSQLLKEYEINIRFLSVGCVISVGCKSIPFTSVNEGMEALNAYIKNPYEETKKWKAIFEKSE